MKEYIGNDIVDLNLDGVLDKYSNKRFLNRVLAHIEKEYLEKSLNPGLLLWFLWTAKEAGFKALKKLNPDTVFAHKEFLVILDDPAGLINKAVSKAEMNVNDIKIHLDWQSHKDWVYCNAIIHRDEETQCKIFDYKIMKTSDVYDLSDSFTEDDK